VDIDLAGCVVVSDVEKDSQAWTDGLRADMLITHVGAARVTSPREFHAAVKDKSGPVTLRLIAPSGDRSERTTLVVRASAS
jgi:S1-C subfamily serine protease